METNEVKKWKTIAIAAILVAVIGISSVAVMAGRGGKTAAAGSEQNAAAVTETETGTAEAEAGAEVTETEAVEAEAVTEAAAPVDANEMLSLWNEDAEARKQLIAYMETITDETSPDFIPVENRIAVFDFDGTLFCETDPNYFDYTSRTAPSMKSFPWSTARRSHPLSRA